MEPVRSRLLQAYPDATDTRTPHGDTPFETAPYENAESHRINGAMHAGLGPARVEKPEA